MSTPAPAEQFGIFGNKMDIASNQPLPVGDTEKVWFVGAGTLDIFFMRTENAQPIGARRHVLRLFEGRVMFGLNAESVDPGLALFASASPGANILETSLKQFR